MNAPTKKSAPATFDDLRAVIERMDRIEEALARNGAQIAALADRCDGLVELCTMRKADTDKLFEQLSDVRDHQTGMNDTLFAATEELRDVAEKVGARNKSAAVKRNMTDDDARRTMTGDLKDMSHKDAAEVIGLTYSQVYSCRLEFTFKHVHKELREAKWVNPWKI